MTAHRRKQLISSLLVACIDKKSRETDSKIACVFIHTQCIIFCTMRCTIRSFFGPIFPPPPPFPLALLKSLNESLRKGVKDSCSSLILEQKDPSLYVVVPGWIPEGCNSGRDSRLFHTSSHSGYIWQACNMYSFPPHVQCL